VLSLKRKGKQAMNSLKRCMCVINHEIPDRVPVIAQDAQVAAYLAGLNCIEYATDADKRASAIIEQRAYVVHCLVRGNVYRPDLLDVKDRSLR